MKKSRGSGDRGTTSLFSGERVSKIHPRIEACGDVDELNSVIGVVIAHLPADGAELADEIRGIQSDLMHIGVLLATTSASKATDFAERSIDARTKALEHATDRMEGRLPRLTGFVLPGGHVSAAWAQLARTVCRRAERRVVDLMGAAGEAGEGRGGGGETSELKANVERAGIGGEDAADAGASRGPGDEPGIGGEDADEAGTGGAPGEKPGRGGADATGTGGGSDRGVKAAASGEDTHKVGSDDQEERLRTSVVYLNRLSDYLFALARRCNQIAGIPDTLWSK
jgi:cob(I)alamin adenosyltransferase